MSIFISTDDDTARQELGLYYYSAQKELLRELAIEAEAKLCRHMDARGISFDDAGDTAVILQRTLFRMAQDVLKEKYNDQNNIDEAKAFLMRVNVLLDSVGTA